jgi:hypothetical protein
MDPLATCLIDAPERFLVTRVFLGLLLVEVQQRFALQPDLRPDHADTVPEGLYPFRSSVQIIRRCTVVPFNDLELLTNIFDAGRVFQLLCNHLGDIAGGLWRCLQQLVQFGEQPTRLRI